jgi:Calcineurin-like phosphoesterase
MTDNFGIQPEPFEFEAEDEWNLEAGGAAPLQVSARILWPALGFPAVIAPRQNGSTDPLEGNPGRCICVLILSNRKYLSKEDAAHYLRIVQWSDRTRRYIPDGQLGSFRPEDIQVINDDGGKRLAWPKSDALGAAVVFGASRSFTPGKALEENSIAASLAHRVREFYKTLGLAHLHEIRVSEAASAKFTGEQYHLFWNGQPGSDNTPSNEMQMLLQHFAPPRRKALGAAWARHFQDFMDEYKFDYGALHQQPYQRDDGQKRLTEVLHPVFIKRLSRPLQIGHVTDTHVDVRADVYEANLKAAGKIPGVSFNNYNTDFVAIYGEAREQSDVVLLTGDLIDYGRGHVGASFGGMYQNALARNDAYHYDRNWFLFYYLLASGGNYTKPAYTILGNHDWRLNPYPPFAPGAPEPESLFHDAKDYNHQDYWKDVIKVAHGPGHERKFAYTIGAESNWGAALWALTHPVKAVTAVAKDFNVESSPVQTTVESVAWYLMLINPFLDYWFKLPSGQQILMLDWAKNEELTNTDDPRTFRRFGPRAASMLTPLQQWHVNEFVDAKGQAKIIGVHAPPLGPFGDWSDSDLAKGIKRYARGEESRLRWPDARNIQNMIEHPLLAIRPSAAPYGISAENGSFVNNRSWFLQKVADPRRGVRLILSGHIHRNGLLVIGTGKLALRNFPNLPPVTQTVRTIRGVSYAEVRGLRPPAVAATPATRNTYLGPLYVNTTSAGPRGSQCEGRCRYVPPGLAIISLASDGTIGGVSARQIIPKPPVQANVARRVAMPPPRTRVAQRETGYLFS